MKVKEYQKYNRNHFIRDRMFAFKTDKLLFVLQMNRNTNKHDTLVIGGSNNIKKQILGVFPDDVTLEFNPITNRYNNQGHAPP